MAKPVGGCRAMVLEGKGDAKMEQQLQLLTDEQMRRFITHGYLILQTNFSDEFHRKLLEQLDYVYENEGNPGNNLLPRIRELQKVFDSPEIRGALTSVLGPDYIMHTHRYGHLNNIPTPGGWHKDSYWGNYRMRNHMPWWAMIMYFPQDTPLELGPTGVIPGTQNYESRTFESDEQEHEARAAGKAGTFILIHYDIWHRSTPNLLGKQRYMLKFEFMRTKAPTEPSWAVSDPEWRAPAQLDVPIVRHDVMWKETWDFLCGKGGRLAEQTGGASDADADEIDRLKQQLADADANVRAEAANRLGVLGASAVSAGGAEALAEALTDSFEPVRLNAAYGLAAMGTPGVEALLQALHHDDVNVSRAAAYGLAVSGAPAVDGLIAALSSDRFETVMHAAFALGELRDRAGKAAPKLVELVSHPSEFVRRTAVEALGNIESGPYADAIVNALTKALKDEDYQVRFWAGLALAKRGPQAASSVPQLVEALDDENRYVSGHAAIALRQIGTPDAMKVLLNYLFNSRWCPITTPQNQWYP
jgi:HEAT repeat protein